MDPVPFLLALVLLAGCGGSAGTSTPRVAETPAAIAPPGLSLPAPPATGTPADDWTTFAHDFRRTAYQSQSVGVSKQNVGALTLRWKVNVGGSVDSSPLVAGGLVYIASLGGTVSALDVESGSTAWQQSLAGRAIAMTPTLADGKLFVGTHSFNGDTFAALDAATGKIVWNVPVGGSGCIRGEPVVTGGRVFEGVSCGDPPGCNQGGVNAYDENTGAVIFSWKTTSAAGNGGGQWSPISYDGQRLYFGTGNVCSVKSTTSDAVVAMQPNGTTIWSYPPVDPIRDDDFGGGPLLNNGQVFAAGKNGYLYDLDAATGALIWSLQLGQVDGYGPIGTPTTDGSMLVISSGYASDPTKTAGAPGGGLDGVTPGGALVWRIPTRYPVFGYAAIANGIAFADLDSTIAAVDVTTGSRLWSYAASATFYASPAVVPSGLYSVDLNGNVYAFSWPAAGASAKARPHGDGSAAGEGPARAAGRTTTAY